MNFNHTCNYMIGETGAVLLGLLLMEINGAEKVCKSLPTYCSNYLPLFEHRESVLFSMIRDYI